MSRFKSRIEDRFGLLARWLFDNRLKSLAVIAALLAALFSQLPQLRFDTSTEAFFRQDDPSLIDTAGPSLVFRPDAGAGRYLLPNLPDGYDVVETTADLIDAVHAVLAANR